MGIRIELHNSEGSYFAGQVVSGRVVVEIHKLKQVSILLQGRGRVHWAKEKRSTVNRQWDQNRAQNCSRSRSVHYSADERYTSLLSILAGDGENHVILPEGPTTYPFHFLLPTDLPSSFNSHIGQISYILRGEMRKSSFLGNCRDRAVLPFTVNGIVNLNLQPEVTLPLKCEQAKGKVNIVLSLPTRTGFVPGEAINFKTDITNGSYRQIISVKASLQQVTHFTAQGQSKTMKRRVCEIRGPELGIGEHRIWVGNLHIRAIPPTKLGSRSKCHLIDHQYFFYLKVRMYGVGRSLESKLPVTIGTIPLEGTFGNFQSIPQIVSAIGMPMLQLPPSHSRPGYGVQIVDFGHGVNGAQIESGLNPSPVGGCHPVCTSVL